MIVAMVQNKMFLKVRV